MTPPTRREKCKHIPICYSCGNDLKIKTRAEERLLNATQRMLTGSFWKEFDQVVRAARALARERERDAKKGKI